MLRVGPGEGIALHTSIFVTTLLSPHFLSPLSGGQVVTAAGWSGLDGEGSQWVSMDDRMVD